MMDSVGGTQMTQAVPMEEVYAVDKVMSVLKDQLECAVCMSSMDPAKHQLLPCCNKMICQKEIFRKNKRISGKDTISCPFCRADHSYRDLKSYGMFENLSGDYLQSLTKHRTCQTGPMNYDVANSQAQDATLSPPDHSMAATHHQHRVESVTRKYVEASDEKMTDDAMEAKRVKYDDARRVVRKHYKKNGMKKGRRKKKEKKFEPADTSTQIGQQNVGSAVHNIEDDVGHEIANNAAMVRTEKNANEGLPGQEDERGSVDNVDKDVGQGIVDNAAMVHTEHNDTPKELTVQELYELHFAPSPEKSPSSRTALRQDLQDVLTEELVNEDGIEIQKFSPTEHAAADVEKGTNVKRPDRSKKQPLSDDFTASQIQGMNEMNAEFEKVAQIPLNIETGARKEDASSVTLTPALKKTAPAVRRVKIKRVKFAELEDVVDDVRQSRQAAEKVDEQTPNKTPLTPPRRSTPARRAKMAKGNITNLAKILDFYPGYVDEGISDFDVVMENLRADTTSGYIFPPLPSLLPAASPKKAGSVDLDTKLGMIGLEPVDQDKDEEGEEVSEMSLRYARKSPSPVHVPAMEALDILDTIMDHRPCEPMTLFPIQQDHCDEEGEAWVDNYERQAENEGQGLEENWAEQPVSGDSDTVQSTPQALTDNNGENEVGQFLTADDRVPPNTPRTDVMDQQLDQMMQKEGLMEKLEKLAEHTYPLLSPQIGNEHDEDTQPYMFDEEAQKLFEDEVVIPETLQAEENFVCESPAKEPGTDGDDILQHYFNTSGVANEEPEVNAKPKKPRKKPPKKKKLQKKGVDKTEKPPKKKVQKKGVDKTGKPPKTKKGQKKEGTEIEEEVNEDLEIDYEALKQIVSSTVRDEDVVMETQQTQKTPEKESVDNDGAVRDESSLGWLAKTQQKTYTHYDDHFEQEERTVVVSPPNDVPALYNTDVAVVNDQFRSEDKSLRKFTITYTFLTDDQIYRLGVLRNAFGFGIMDKPTALDFERHITHVIVGELSREEKRNVNAVRGKDRVAGVASRKLVLGMSRGRCIVSDSWIDQCFTSKIAHPPVAFEVHGVFTTTHSKIMYNGPTISRNGLVKPLRNTIFFIYDMPYARVDDGEQNTDDEKSDLACILNGLGARVVNSMDMVRIARQAETDIRDAYFVTDEAACTQYCNFDPTQRPDCVHKFHEKRSVWQKLSSEYNVRVVDRLWIYTLAVCMDINEEPPDAHVLPKMDEQSVNWGKS